MRGNSSGGAASFGARVLLMVACAVVNGPAVAGPPDLDGTIPILVEDFSDGLRRYDGARGIWSTLPRRDRLMTNAEETVFVDARSARAPVTSSSPPVHVPTEEGLDLRTVALAPADLAAVRDYMRATRQGARADAVRFATGMISTAETLALAYGYFEIEARIPRGRGRWPAFWLTFAGQGWPPEIDVFEAYGQGIAAPTRRDDTFNVAVHFDRRDAEGHATHSVDVVNDLAPAGFGGAPDRRVFGDLETFAFRRTLDTRTELGADIYGDFHVYAVLWTPSEIRYFFGPDRAGLREIFRAPTPPDAHDPMYVIVNDQFTAAGGWWPASERELDDVLSPGNGFAIRRIEIRALDPERTLGADAAFDDGPSEIVGGPDGELIAPGEGFDVIRLGSGADTLALDRGRHGKIVLGFGPDDRAVLRGYPFTGLQDVLRRLTQVGTDVWLSSGAAPFWPQTIVFRDARVENFAASQFLLRWPVARPPEALDGFRRHAPAVAPDGPQEVAMPAGGGWVSDGGRLVRFRGGAGDDHYVVGGAGTVIRESGGGGIDTLHAHVSMSVPANLEHALALREGVHLRGGPGDERLEAWARDTILSGGAGDDLFVLGAGSEGARVHIGEDHGHDRIRGFGDTHVLSLAAALRVRRAEWQMEEVPEGVMVGFGPDQGVLFEGAELDAIRDALR